MKNENIKIREPYEPKDTPKPPQIIEPNSKQQRENPVEGEAESRKSPGKKPDKKQHLLSDDADINDETTI